LTVDAGTTRAKGGRKKKDDSFSGERQMNALPLWLGSNMGRAGLEPATFGS